MLFPFEQDHDYETLRTYLKSDVRALRERAAMILAMREPEAAAIMLAMAKDDTQSPLMRGAAIKSLGSAEQNVPALLELLDRRYWFFGASGSHFDVHSLALVIDQLRDSNDPAVRKRLEQMHVEILELPLDQRDYVEWVLDMALERASDKP
jgi:HEAT repeat protein